MGKGVVDEAHLLFMGNAALSANDCVHCVIDAAALIINVGPDAIEKRPKCISTKPPMMPDFRSVVSSDMLRRLDASLSGSEEREIGQSIDMICETLTEMGITDTG